MAKFINFNENRTFKLPTFGQRIISESNDTTYTIGHPLDKGSFGTVFECTDDWRHDLVAKVLHPNWTPNEMEQRATDEVVSASIVRSPHIVYVHDAFVYEGAYYIISERCLKSLRDLLNDAHQNQIWFEPLAKALLHATHYMHTRGLLHGDIHPGNIFLHCKEDALLPASHMAYDFKLGDFGQTRPLSMSRTRSTCNLGCAPPEFFDLQFGPADHRSDLYQIGLIFLQLFTNRHSFSQANVLSGLPRQLAEQIRHPASRVIARLLRRHANFRYDTALDVWKDLQIVLDAKRLAS